MAGRSALGADDGRDVTFSRRERGKKIVRGNGAKQERKRANLTSKYLDCRIDGIDTWSGVYRYPHGHAPWTKDRKEGRKRWKGSRIKRGRAGTSSRVYTPIATAQCVRITKNPSIKMLR